MAAVPDSPSQAAAADTPAPAPAPASAPALAVSQSPTTYASSTTLVSEDESYGPDPEDEIDGDRGPHPRQTGFHLAFGLGPSGGWDVPGIATIFKIGGTVTPALRVFYYAQNHWYKSPTAFGGLTPGKWRIQFINGIGMDYFFHPRVGARLALGGGGDVAQSAMSDSAAIGFAYAGGFTFEMLNGPSRLSIDPMFMVTNFDQRKLCETDSSWCDYWSSRLQTAITLNYVFH